MCEGCGDRRVCGAFGFVRAGASALEHQRCARAAATDACVVVRAARRVLWSHRLPCLLRMYSSVWCSWCRSRCGCTIRKIVQSRVGVRTTLRNPAHLPPAVRLKRGSRSMALPALGCLSLGEEVAQSSTAGAEPTGCASLRRQAVLAWSGERVWSECGRTNVKAPEAWASECERPSPVAPLVCMPPPRGRDPVRGARRKHQRCARAAATDACVVVRAARRVLWAGSVSLHRPCIAF